MNASTAWIFASGAFLGEGALENFLREVSIPPP
jgi:hypothetical protein